MPFTAKHRRRFGGGAVLLSVLALGIAAPAASASGPPIVTEAWASEVFSSSASLRAKINPNGLSTGYHFEYITKAAYEANIAAAKEPFNGALRLPVSSDANLAAGTSPVTVAPAALSGLAADTKYFYRAAAKNSASSPNYVTGTTLNFITQSSAGTSILADSRGWEMVTPVDKNGGQVGAPGTLAGGGVLQAAAAGGQVTYGSEASFGVGQGGPPASQYVATRSGTGWTTANISAPLFSGGYDNHEAGAPYQLFSADLARGLLLNGDHCRGDGTSCAVANPPLAGTDAPEGYQNYYLRDGNGFTALLGASNSGFLGLEPEDFDLSLAGASPDLVHGVLSTCAALTATATEVPLGEGCDPTQPNLYEYGGGSGLGLVNTLPGAELAASAGAISANGARVYWKNLSDGNLYLREGPQVKQVDAAVGGGGTFQTASLEGDVAFYTKGGHLYRYEPAGPSTADLTPSGGVEGVLGASNAGDYVYYMAGGVLLVRHGATTTPVADGADASDFLANAGTARVSADGTRLLFVATARLTEYDNTDLGSGNPDAEVYLYDGASSPTLICVSCNPTNGRPIGPSTIPGSIANGSAPGAIRAYKPRALSADGQRVFFDSDDALVSTDTNHETDAYQWEAQGKGSCGRAGGCVSLISGGRSFGGATFVDASADGSDVYFLTEGSLVETDSGALDLYDARIGGGFPAAEEPIQCEADACQPLPSAPVDPTLTTRLEGPGNGPVRYPNRKHCRKNYVKRHGKCVKKSQGKRHGRRSAR